MFSCKYEYKELVKAAVAILTNHVCLRLYHTHNEDLVLPMKVPVRLKLSALYSLQKTFLFFPPKLKYSSTDFSSCVKMKDGLEINEP